MIKRTCPHCGTDNYSADTVNPWTCCECGKEIKEEDKPCESTRLSPPLNPSD